MPAPPDDARCTEAEVLSVTPTGTDAVILRVAPDRDPGPIRASRFFMLKRTDGTSPFIPRPYSIYGQQGGELEFLVKVMGPGSRALAAQLPGDRMRLIGPLGNGWPTLDGDGPPWVMVAGGVGSAPFPLAIEQALAGMDGAAPCPPERITVVFGAATHGMLYDLLRFRDLGVRVFTATDDGSDGDDDWGGADGFRGNVVQRLKQLWSTGELPERVRLLTCGPEKMMEAVGHLADQRGLACWYSLESLMGCGVGICNGCPVRTQPDGPLGAWPNAKCCVEGPVFSTKAVSLEPLTAQV